MRWRNTTTGFGSLAIAFHWLMLVLIVAVYALMELKGISRKGTPLREGMAAWHYMLGLSVFGLTWLRLLVRATGPAPRIEPPPAAWEARLASLVHLLLYALMIGLPVLGWLTLSAQGDRIPFFGIELPALVGPDKGMARIWKDVHETGATIGYFLIGLHAAAALFHHYVRRDNTLTLMWRPRRAAP
ncbi:MAG: cytochrome b [Casimicrobiaceae bacterium]